MFDPALEVGVVGRKGLVQSESAGSLAGRDRDAMRSIQPSIGSGKVRERRDPALVEPAIGLGLNETRMRESLKTLGIDEIPSTVSFSPN